MSDPAYNVNAAIIAEKMDERLFYPDRLTRVREIEENDIEPGRFEERAPIHIPWDGVTCRSECCTRPFTTMWYCHHMCAECAERQIQYGETAAAHNRALDAARKLVLNANA